MGLSTFAGAASGQYAWLHFAIVGLWSFVAGLLVALGPRGATVGLQAIIAIIVFGRFPQPPGSAAALAGLVVAGGAAQVLFCACVGLSLGLRQQRSALAGAYRRLASLATSGGVLVPVSANLDEAQATLSSPALIGDAAIMAFSNLVTEGRRIRLELLGLQLLVDQYIRAGPMSDTALPDAIARLRETTATALRDIADAVESGDAAALRRLGSTGGGVIGPCDDVVTAAEHDHAVLAARIADHAAALAGQVRAVVGLAAGAPWNQPRRIPVAFPGGRAAACSLVCVASSTRPM
jgi:hypothetical protein